MTPRQDEDRLLEHEADGIQEYDNPMPRWWLWIFYATILFSVVYALNLPGLGPGKGRIASYERELAEAEARYGAARKPAGPALDDSTLLAIAHDAGQRELGRITYENTCSPCHRADGGGGIGPNLADRYWLHGSRPTEVLKTVSDGVLDKGMPAWSAALKPEEIAAVAAYVTTFRGTNPKDAKAPQGVPADSAGAE